MFLLCGSQFSLLYCSLCPPLRVGCPAHCTLGPPSHLPRPPHPEYCAMPCPTPCTAQAYDQTPDLLRGVQAARHRQRLRIQQVQPTGGVRNGGHLLEKREQTPHNSCPLGLSATLLPPALCFPTALKDPQTSKRIDKQLPKRTKGNTALGAALTGGVSGLCAWVRVYVVPRQSLPRWGSPLSCWRPTLVCLVITLLATATLACEWGPKVSSKMWPMLLAASMCMGQIVPRTRIKRTANKRKDETVTVRYTFHGSVRTQYHYNCGAARAVWQHS